MNKDELVQRLIGDHDRFIESVRSLSSQNFLLSHNGKWTAGQQLDHIYRSVSAVQKAFLFPGFFIRIVFGKTNRHARTYNEIVEKYKKKLAEGGRASGRFVPQQINFEQREKLVMLLKQAVTKMARHTGRFSEKQLDLLILPHPLLGKLTLREMIYFTIHHVEHHKKQMIKNLASAGV